jgi:hypothetical protein
VAPSVFSVDCFTDGHLTAHKFVGLLGFISLLVPAGGLAMFHRLCAGVDINTIRAWLGHVSIDTTNIYAETDLEMKAKALAHCEIAPVSCHKRWRQDIGLMTFLRSL